MRTIWKFEVEVTDEPLVQMPVGAQVLSRVVAPNVDTLWIWAVVDSAQPTEWVRFRVVGTGHPFSDADELVYVGTATAAPFVWHVFQESDHG